jgi:NTP pyrophosphatase (non-canonical NTP hydrolase)
VSIYDEIQSKKAAAEQAGQGMEFLLGLQSKVEAQWGRTVDPADPEAVSGYVRDVVLCATDELHELLAEVHWKPWKDSRGIRDIDAYREELADVLHFILDLYLAAGLTGQDVVNDYVAKHEENLRRLHNTQYRIS